MVPLRKAKFSSVLAVSFLVIILTVSASPDSAVLGTWRDINPTAYISPPANPPLNSVYMLSANEGWSVGSHAPAFAAAIVAATPAMLHYDGSTWNLVPVPKFPSDPNIPSGYTLTSVNFGRPNQPISRNDGWAVGFGFAFTRGYCGPPAVPALTCAVALHWDGVTWREQVGGFTGAGAVAGALMSVFMVSPTDVWAVGCNLAGGPGCVGPGGAGSIWHWTGVPGLGGSWSFAAAVPTRLFSVFMVSATEGWAVGAGGAIFHYFGGAWAAFPSPVPAAVTLNSVFMISPTDGWAVGTGGTILHYTAGTWTGPVSPGTTTAVLRSVFMVSSTEGWATGDTGSILHYSGGTWTALPINQIPNLPALAFAFSSVYLNTATDGWAVGTAGAILHFDGVNWGTVTSSTLTELNSISFGPPLTGTTNPNDGWAVGRSTATVAGPPFEPTIIHWNGFMWTKGVAIGTTNDLFSVFMVTSGDVWTVGGGASTTATCAVAPCPVIMHFTGGSWNTITPPPGSYVLSSVFMVSTTEGWAVGCVGALVGMCVQPVPPPSGGGGDRLAGGTGIILHYTVTGGVGTWAIFPSPPTPPLNSVFMLGPNEGWAVGDAATVLHYTVTGGVGTWNVVPVPGLPANRNLNSIFMLSPTSGWAVGGAPPPPAIPQGPEIIYWDGTHWIRVATPTVPGGPPPIVSPPVLRSIYCTGPNDCWSVGRPRVAGEFLSAIFHWDGIAWTHITLAPALLGLGFPPLTAAAPFLNSVYMLSPSRGWIVGSGIPNIGPLGFTLSTILRFEAFGGLLTATSTTTKISTVTTSTSLITSSFLSTFSSLTSTTSTTTTTTTSSVSGGGIPGFPVESIIIGIGIGLATLTLLRRRRATRPAG